ncbi:hypothetical protein G7Y79_00017g043620 [Physcia stellaris]|nr:hypothetical protein G7Y79_00017g043620 [Physcia stellaris]
MMSPPSTLLPKQGRRVGLRQQDWHGKSIHGPHLNKELPIVRQPTPDDDVLRSPEGSSDEDLGGSDSEDGPAPKRRKGSGSESPVTMGSKSRLALSESSNTHNEFTTAPSNIQATSFTTSQKTDVSDEEETFSQPQSRRSEITYKSRTGSNNIHTKSSNSQETKRPKTSPAKTSQDAKGFLKRDTTELEAKFSDIKGHSKGGSKFKAPRKIDMSSLRRSTRNSNSLAEGEDLKLDDIPSNSNITPTKSQKERPTFKAPVVPEITSPPKAEKPIQRYRQSLVLDDTDVGTRDLESVLQKAKTQSFLAFKVPPSSTTESSLLSTSNEAGSSSSLRSPLSSPGKGSVEDDMPKPKLVEAGKDEPAPALCPVCKVPVERSFLEEFNNGKPLRARQQTYFCKAHKIRAAEQEWAERGYPQIDWAHFDKRLQKFHPVIDDILAGRKTSYYRNAFEDRISKGQMKSLKATLLDVASMEGVIPGYYGTRGARAIIENITSKFASRIRRLASSDRVISTGGVPSYIQLVLAPEMAVQLVMDDTKVDEENARSILRESVDIGNLLNEEQDEAIHVVESDDELGM